jgi:two-component system chemotaxis response regulator CheY
MSEAGFGSEHRHAQFLVERLRAIGVSVELPAGAATGEGILELSSTPFETLGQPFVLERARFYTLGHNRIKLFDPRILFALAAVDVSRCENLLTLQTAVHRAWMNHVRDLRTAFGWLGSLGASVRVGDRGTAVLLDLPDIKGPPVRVRSRREFLFPSAGPLEKVSLAAPADRVHLPPQDLEDAVDLELGLVHALEYAATQAAREPARESAPDPASPRAPNDEAPRILVVDDDRAVRAAAESALSLQGFRVDVSPDPLRGLEALRQSSYDAVLIDAQMPRMDGLELAIHIRELPGMSKIPMLLLDDRMRSAYRDAARTVGASGYVVKPARWSELAERLVEFLLGWTERRFDRFPVRLKVEAVGERTGTPDLTYQLGRGGMGLRTRRDISLGVPERYRITLPERAGTIRVDGMPTYRLSEPGQVSLRVGVRFLGFPDQDESRWVGFIERLARRD